MPCSHGDIARNAAWVDTRRPWWRADGSAECFGTCVGGEGVSHGAESAGVGARLRTTGGSDWSTASVIVVANAALDGLDSCRGDSAQQSLAAACVIWAGGAPSS
jgi:hypothetical protein